MKIEKFFTILIIGFFLLYGVAYAVPVSWDKTTNLLQPLPTSRSDEIRFSYFTATSTTATSTVNGGLNIAGGGLKVGTIISCSQALETDSNGTLICGTDATGGAGSNPFNSLTVGGTVYQATTSPLYLSGGMITGTTTIGKLTATTSADFLAGLTITCTGCVTDANVADLAVGGDVTGTLSAISVTDDSHNHGASTISGLGTLDISGLDISDDTNLAGTFPIVLTGDTLSFGWAYPFIGNATSSVLTLSSAPIFSSLTGVLKGNGASALTVAADGTDFSLITALTCTGTDKFSAVTADGTFTCTTDSTAAGAADPFTWATNFGTTSAATTSSMWLRGGAYYASSTATSTFEGGLSAGGLTSTEGLTVSGGNITSTGHITLNNDSAYQAKDASGNVITLLYINSGNDAHFLPDLTGAVDSAYFGFNSPVPFQIGGSCCGGNAPTTFTIDTSGDNIFKPGGSAVLTLSSTNATFAQELIVSDTATSTFAGGITVNALTMNNLGSSNCSALSNGGKLTTDSNGGVICTSDTGSTFSYPFTPQTIGGTVHQATSSPMYFSSGLLAASSTLGYLNVGYMDATSTTATSTFAGGFNAGGSSGLFVTNVGRVGIGTAAPGAKLDVNGQIWANTTGFSVQNSTIQMAAFTQYGVALPSAGRIIWQDQNRTDIGVTDLGISRGAAGKLYVGSGDSGDYSGTLIASNVGIGTTTPGQKLSVAGDILGNNIIGSYFTGTTTASSTFAGGASIAGLATTKGLTITGGALNLNATNYIVLDGNGLVSTAGTLAVGAGTCITANANDVAVTSNCTDAATVDSINGASLLRSDASDNYTSGTLTFDSGTALTLAAGSTFTYSGSATSTWASAGLSVGGGGLASSAGLTISGGAFRLNNESFIDFTGTGLDNTAGVLTPNCATITGSAALCDGDDATGGGASFGFPFTMLTNFGTTTFATTTALWLQSGAIYASSTATSTFVGALQGGKQTLIEFVATAGEPPATTFATFDTRNNHAVLDFDATLNEIAYFTGTMPQTYSGRAVSVVIKYAATSATTNTVQWDISFERLLVGTDNLDTNSFGATSTATVTVPGTAGVIGMASINVTAGTNMDGIVAGDLFRLNVTRNGAGDSATGDAELISVIIKEE